MVVARVYILHAAEGRDTEVEAALTDIAKAVRPIAGCERVEVMRDRGNERRFIFTETFTDVEAHERSAEQMPKALLSRLIAALDGPPDNAYFDYLARL